MANEVAIILKAVDKASGEINKVTTAGGKLSAGFKALTGFSLGAAGGLAVAGVAITKIISYTKEAIAQNDAYITSIVDMARFTGDQTDAMSRLVQVADDVFLSQEALNNAMSIGAKKGLDMSVAGILKLADTYNALGSVQEKNKLLNDNFGRSGLAVGKLLEQGSEGIRKNMNAVSDSLVVTKQSVETAYAYKRSLDAVNDSLDGMANTVAQGTMPALTAFNTKVAEFVDSVNESGVVTKVLAGALDIATKALRFWDGVLSDDLSKWWPAKEGAEEFTKALEGIPGAMEAAVISGADMISMTASLTTIENEYTSNVATNNAELLTLMEARANLKRRGFSEESAQIKEIDAKLDANATNAGENAAAHELATQRIILSYAQQLLAADGLTQEEAAFLIQKGVDMGIYSETAAAEMQRVIIEAGKLTTAINNIPDKKTIKIDFSGAPIPNFSKSGAQKDGGTSATGSMSSGGWTTVGERGPEVVDLPRGSRVYSNTESKQMGGGGMTQSDMSQLAKLFAVAVATEMQKANG